MKKSHVIMQEVDGEELVISARAIAFSVVKVRVVAASCSILPTVVSSALQKCFGLEAKLTISGHSKGCTNVPTPRFLPNLDPQLR